MRINRVVLTQKESEWLAGSVLKATLSFEVKAQKEPEILQRTTYKLLLKIKKACEKLDLGADNSVLFQPKERAFLKQHIDSVVVTLLNGALPTYMRRNDETNIIRTKEKIELLTLLRGKL